MELIIGSHVSFKKETQLLGCVLESLSYGSNTFMFYTGAPQNTNRNTIDDNLTKQAKELMIKENIDINNVIVHAPYIINLASYNNQFSISFLRQELERCNQLGISKIVLHPGSAVGITKEEGTTNIIDALNIILNNDNNVIICLETMAGKGNEIGRNFEELKLIIDGVKYKDKIGVCLDTCHLNDSGYDVTNFDKLLDNFDKLIGIERIKCIHINDSKNILGSKKDRHENIGLGNISFEDMLKIIYNKKISNIPKILETPYITKDDFTKDKIYPPYKFEIEMIKNKKNKKELIKEIREYYN